MNLLQVLLTTLLFSSCRVQSQTQGRLETTSCVDWETVQTAFDAAKGTWSAPACYDFTYTFLGFQTGTPAVQIVQVRDGSVMAEGSDGDKTMDDFFDMIESFCISNCPEEGAHKCVVAYDSTDGFPTQISIDVNEYEADEERLYELAGFSVVDCSSGGMTILQPEREQDVNEDTTGKLEAIPCTNWEDTKAAMDTAKATWSSPDCYDFSYTNLGFQVGFPTVTEVQVRDGTPSNADDKSVDDFFDMIESLCVADCPDQGAQSCTVSYAAEGYPSSIFIDMSQYEGDEESIYELTNFLDCSASQVAIEEGEAELNLEKEKCTDWETTKTDLEDAKSLWADPPCYDFSYTFLGFQVGGPQAMIVQVRNGVISGDGDKSIQDFFDMIESLCVSNCPEEGAQTCNIGYATEGFPSSIFIDMSQYEADEERIYELSDYALIDCPETPPQNIVEEEEQAPRENNDGEASGTKCVNYEAVSESLFQARDRWSDPLCYDFTYKEDNLAPVDVEVRYGASTEGEMTISDFLNNIEKHCVSKCNGPSQSDSSMMHRCHVVYDEVEGYPKHIEMDPSGEREGDQSVVVISHFSVVRCDAIQDDSSTAEKPPDAPQATPEPTTASPTPPPSILPGRLPYPYVPPSAEPSAEPSGTESPVKPPLPRLDQVRNYLLTRGISSPDDLGNSTRPQYLAMKWISDTDALKQPIPVRAKDAFLFEQRYVLAVIYFALQGDDWAYPTGFLGAVSECDWNFGLVMSDGDGEVSRLGAHCNEKGEVSEIILVGSELKGTIPEEIGHLKSLEVLNLSHNSISGSLPDKAKRLNKLGFVALDGNSISGSIPPWIGKLKKLEYFAIGDNSLTGELPPFDGLVNLRDLALNGNLLTGTLEPLYSITSLQSIFLSNNAFSGKINDTSFLQLEDLVILDLSANSLSGSLPGHFLKCQILDLHQNSLTGELPAVEKADYPMESLSLYGNKLSGGFPASLLLLEELRHLDLSYNDLQGPLPDSFVDWRNLEYLFLARNPFEPGPIPLLAPIPNLKEVTFKGTNRIGAIPDWIGSLSELVLLDLQDNELSGQVPDSLGSALDLRFLLLSNNNLDGSIPSSFENLMELEILLLDKNDMEGSAASICASIVSQTPRFFAADCSEIQCECCNICCYDDDPSCNDIELIVSFDSGYERGAFSFADELVEVERLPSQPPHPIPTIVPSEKPSLVPSENPSLVASLSPSVQRMPSAFPSAATVSSSPSPPITPSPSTLGAPSLPPTNATASPSTPDLPSALPSVSTMSPSSSAPTNATEFPSVPINSTSMPPSSLAPTNSTAFPSMPTNSTSQPSSSTTNETASPFANMTYTPSVAPTMINSTQPASNETMNATSPTVPPGEMNSTDTGNETVPTASPTPVNDTVSPTSNATNTTGDIIPTPENTTEAPTGTPQNETSTTSQPSGDPGASTGSPTVPPAASSTALPTNSPTEPSDRISTGAVDLRAFAISLSVEGEWNRDGFIQTMKHYLASEMKAAFDGFVRIELDSMNERRLQAGVKDYSVDMTGKAFFSGAPPDRMDVTAQQSAALADTRALQGAIDEADLEAKIQITGVRVMEDSITSPSPEPADPIGLISGSVRAFSPVTLTLSVVCLVASLTEIP